MKMKCDLELRLFPLPSYDSDSESDSDTSVVETESSISCETSESKKSIEESKKITIFYNGEMCLSTDVTHLQAKSILSIASKEMEEKVSSKTSMKRSLQCFLQKRKSRIQATSPYFHHSRR